MSIASILEDSSPAVHSPVQSSVTWSEVDRTLPVPARHFAWTLWLGPVMGLVLLVPGIAIIALLSIMTKLTSRGPGIYRQMRVGLKGRTFVLYKIRTMSHNAEAATGPVWASGRTDPRVTRFGRFLRTSHLDEFPQLFNVVRGDMALIGPRPERPEFTQLLAQEIPGYVGRLVVKPGITGLAQIDLPPDTDIESVRKKLELDLEYITRSTLSLDAKILLCTALKMIGLRGYDVAKWLGLVSWPTGMSRIRKRVRRQRGVVPDTDSSHEFGANNDGEQIDVRQGVRLSRLQEASRDHCQSVSD